MVVLVKIYLCIIVIFVDVFYSWVVFFLGVKCDVVFGCLN